MAWIYLIAAPEDETHAEALADWLKQRGHVVRPEMGKYGFPPARRGEVTLALWSRAAMMSARRFLMTNRAIDAWEDQRLVMVKLDQGLHPNGLADVEMIDLTFEPARQSRYFDVDRAIRDADAAYMQRMNAPAEPPSSQSGEATNAAAGLPESDGRIAPREDEAPLSLQEPDHHAVFVSYAHADSDTVLPLVNPIEQTGNPVWIDREGIKSGQTWAGMIVRAIKSAQVFCLMCSQKAFASDHVRREVYLADKYKKGLLPVRLDASDMPDDIEYFLAGVQWVDLVDASDAERTERLKTAFAS
ncbi:MAG: toll/interleukin-1 receptor domain-containing protein [Pseudomonadota bacterium]